MIYFFNDNALFAASVGFFGGLGAYSFWRNSSAAGFAGGAVIVAFDLFMRLRNNDQDVPLLAPNAGGHIWFIPVWIISLVVTGIGGMMWLGWL